MRLSERSRAIVIFAVAAIGLGGASEPAHAGNVGLLVPAYFYPTTGGPGGVGDGWAALDAAASTPGVNLTAIADPSDGDFTAVDPNYVSVMQNLVASGGSVVGYVYTDYATRSLASVEANIYSWVTLYGSQVKLSGFFIDQMTSDNSPADLAYYQQLYSYIKSLGASYTVIGNPGTASDQTQAYLNAASPAADKLLTYENTYANYGPATPPSWVSSYPASTFANVVESTPGSDLQNALALAAQRNVGSVYITDEPYSSLPSYWDQEVAAIAGVPEPATWSMLATGGIVVATTIRFKRRSR